MGHDKNLIIEPWAGPPIPDFDFEGHMRPPWAKFTNLPRRSSDWLMGMSESCKDSFEAWWSRRPRADRLSIRTKYPEPQEWAGFGQSQAEPD